MPDPLLTSLCSICHVSAPKYKCPRCGAQTCSLPCNKKHKAWSECNGRRDPTTYVPPSRLRTAAGVDHDYNFLHGMEVSMERSEKRLVEEKGLVRPEELRPLTVQQIRWRTGRDGQRRKVLVTQALREVKGRKLERGLAQRLGRLNVQMEFVPSGMARQRENLTTLNRRTGRVNWQVEWLVFLGRETRRMGDVDEGRRRQQQGQGDTAVTRVLAKVMDNVPLFEAYQAVLLEDGTGGHPGNRPTTTTTTTNATARSSSSSTRLVEPQQSWGTGRSRWNQALDCIQDATKATWWAFTGAHTTEWPAQREAVQRSQHQFYLAVQGGPVRCDADVPVTALDPGDCLCDILSNTRVLEFPSIYVLPAGAVLPAGYVLAPKQTIAAPATTRLKRKDGAADHDAPLLGKRRRPGIEEGEADSEGDEGPDAEDDAVRRHEGLEAGEILAEQILDESDDDDDTSSSGSDSDEGAWA
ncbi:hypothetical protein E4U53_005775 [Claviceps sorghi]|nr:hypothetical protein E4U53_005775 [Claviceps sorghi]